MRSRKVLCQSCGWDRRKGQVSCEARLATLGQWTQLWQTVASQHHCCCCKPLSNHENVKHDSGCPTMKMSTALFLHNQKRLSPCRHTVWRLNSLYILAGSTMPCDLQILPNIFMVCNCRYEAPNSYSRPPGQYERGLHHGPHHPPDRYNNDMKRESYSFGHHHHWEGPSGQGQPGQGGYGHRPDHRGDFSRPDHRTHRFDHRQDER